MLQLRDRALEWRQIEGEIVGVDLEKTVYLAVNRSGAILWAALSEGATEAALAAKLVEAYGLSPEAAARDVSAFLAVLEHEGLLKE